MKWTFTFSAAQIALLAMSEGTNAVADPEGAQGIRLKPPSSPTVLNIQWNEIIWSQWDQIISVS